MQHKTQTGWTPTQQLLKMSPPWLVKWPPISHYFWQLCQTFLIAGRKVGPGGQRLSRFFDRGISRTKGLFVDTPAHCNLYTDKSNQIGSPMISLLEGDEWPSWDREGNDRPLGLIPIRGKAERARRQLTLFCRG